jgi:pimeloyl-ACP methyl ester carboxylesterase
MDKHSRGFYRNVPQDMVEMFIHFRQEHPLRKRVVGGISWEYMLNGNSSSQPLLLLPGGLGTAESAWRMITRLDPAKYYLLCPSYPEQIGTMTGLADGIAEILGAEGLHSIYLVGGAYGSMLAQVFLHLHGELVDKLVLTHAYPPVPSRVRTVEPTLRIFKYAPQFMIRNILRNQMTGKLPANPPPELKLIAAQIRETLDTKLTREGAVNTYLRMAEFDKQDFTYTDLESWQGKALFILIEGDPTNTEDLRNTLTSLYPGVTLHIIKGSSQNATLEETAEYVRIMEEFFEGKDLLSIESAEQKER